MKCVVNGKLADYARIEEVMIKAGSNAGERVRMATFTIFSPDPNGPEQKIVGSDGVERTFRKGVALNCKAWGEDADIIRDMQKGDMITGAATVRYGDRATPLFVISKLDPAHEIHRQMSSLITAYTSGEISQIFENGAEKEPAFRDNSLDMERAYEQSRQVQLDREYEAARVME